MRKNSYITVTDQFCGAGGSSIGAVAAGAELKLALNHWQLAIETHNSNFPDAHHDCTDISACDPRRYPSTDILITSPECTNHSLAKGKKRKWQNQLDLFGKVNIDPAEERSRATMWDVPRFAEYHRYNLIIVENVVDARQWVMWDAWLHAMRLLGYEHECVYFNSMFAHPTPQSRDRLYVVFWRKGNPRPDLNLRPKAMCHQCRRDVEAVQSWKRQRWGRYRRQYVYCCPDCANEVEPYYYCAANAIDWSLPAQRIGERTRPLKEKTLRRIQVGLDKFAREPFLFDTVHTARDGRDQDMVWPATQPNRTQIGQASHGVVMPPFIANLAYSHATNDRTRAVSGPMFTQTGWQSIGLAVPPYLVDLRGENAPKAVSDALSTVCASGNHHGMVLPFIASYYGTDNNAEVVQAMPTVTTVDRHGLVVPPFLLSVNHSSDRAREVTEPHPTAMPQGNPGLVVPPFILGYYTRPSGVQAAVSGIDEAAPTQSTQPRHYLVQPGDVPSVEECGFRMLQPHEIQAAMAFPSDYVVLGNKRDQVKQLGNAVTPPVMHMLLERCIGSLS